MRKVDLLNELLATYQRHGWELKGALLRPETREELMTAGSWPLEPSAIKESGIDALWFSRPSHQQREAWELRLLAETQYALFETFEPDETEEQRDEVRLEMEARLRDYASSREKT